MRQHGFESRWGRQITVLYNPTQSTTINKHAGFAPIHRLKYQLIPDSEVKALFSGLKGRSITAQGKGACVVALGYGIKHTAALKGQGIMLQRLVVVSRRVTSESGIITHSVIGFHIGGLYLLPEKCPAFGR